MLLQGESPALILNESINGQSAGAIESGFVSTINLSTTSVYCSFLDVDSAAVLGALLLAYQRGVDVRVGLDEDRIDGPGYLQLESFLEPESLSGSNSDATLLTGNAGSGENNLNFCVSDRERVFLSTAPPLMEMLENQSAFTIYLQSDPQVGILRKFNTLADSIVNDGFGSSRQRLDRRNHWLAGQIDVGVYLAPEEDPIDFIGGRIGGARTALLYANSFSANDDNSSTSQRETGDIAYELRQLAQQPLVVGSVGSYLQKDDDSSVDGAEGSSLRYLANNGLPVYLTYNEWPGGGPTAMVLYQNDGRRVAYFGSAPVSARSDSSNDGFFLMIEHSSIADAIESFVRRAYERSISATAAATGLALSIPTDVNGDRLVVISEINWMGAYDNKTGSSSYEYFELYNNTDQPISLAGWRIQCGTGGAFASFSATLPAGAIIGPGQYVVVADPATPVVQRVHFPVSFGSGQVPDAGIDQCRLVDAATRVSDVAGRSGSAFATLSSFLGANDSGSRNRAAMERVALNSSGEDPLNWATCAGGDLVRRPNIAPRYRRNTCGTPGRARGGGGSPPTPPDQSSLIISEWADAGAGVDYIEIVNMGASAVLLDSSFRIVFGPGSSAALTDYLPNGIDDPANRVPLGSGVNIAPGEYILIVDSDVTLANIQAVRTNTLAPNFTGKIFLSTETTLIGANDLLSDNQALLTNGLQQWSRTPSPFTAGTGSYSTLRTTFVFGTDSTTDNAFWCNGAAGTYRTAGQPNTPCAGAPPPPPDQSSLLITEWADAGAGVDYIEITNYGAANVLVESNFSVIFGATGATQATLTDYLPGGVDDPASKIALGAGVNIAPGERFLIVDSDVTLTNIQTIRGYDGFAGKFFLSTESTLIGANDRLSDNPARLDNGVQQWSQTPAPFTAGTNTYSALSNSFSFGTDSTSDNGQWCNGTAGAQQTAGVANSTCP